MKRILTAESVTAGHPDKMADQIADSILDECLRQDASSHVACEVMLTADTVIIAGEISCRGFVDYRGIALAVISEVGYSVDKLRVLVLIHEQSPDIAQAVGTDMEQGAGDQGIMYGYATNESFSRMPLPIAIAQGLTRRLEDCRTNGCISGLMPDGKAQVSIEYEDGVFNRITSIVISAQHGASANIEKIRDSILHEVIESELSEFDLSGTEILINPSGRFVLGGFEADTGLTGRKLMVDSYGGIAHHGGGAFSGKDASKVDRSGAYMARYIACNIVAAGYADQCEVALSYAIGKAEPTSVNVDSFGTGVISDDRIREAVLSVFDLRPAAIIQRLGLTRPCFAVTATGGHFGRSEFAWEQTDMVEQLENALN